MSRPFEAWQHRTHFMGPASCHLSHVESSLPILWGVNAPLLSVKQWHGVVHMQAREDGEVAGFAPILAGQALREAWVKQNSSPADNARQDALESPSRLRVVVLDDSTAPSGSQSILVDQHTGGLLLPICN